jgi:hypothetical protein
MPFKGCFWKRHSNALTEQDPNWRLGRERFIKEDKIALKRKAEHLDFDIDSWYPRLQTFTFNSVLMPISVDMAKAMVTYYQARFNRRHFFTDAEHSLLLTLESDIESQLTALGGEVFARMSSRSPKDGEPLIFSEKSLWEQVEEAIKDCPGANDKMVKKSEFEMQLLKCTSAKQVMNLLLTSERVFSDLLLALDCYHADLNDKWSTSLILREWNNDLRGDFEFRVFVCKGVVTGISQYNHYCKFDSLVVDMNEPQRNQLRDRIIAYVESLSSELSTDSYVLDLGLIKDELVVVELNPLKETTGAALFDWHEDGDGDGKVLKGQVEIGTPEFRVHTETVPGIGDFLEYSLSYIKSLEVAPYDTFYDDLIESSEESVSRGCSIS